MDESDDTGRRAAVAADAAAAGAAIAREAFRTGIAVEQKSRETDVVTQADRDAQETVINHIRTFFPADTIVGEEDGALKQVPETGPAWIVDPIDGTNNFVDGIRAYGTAVAAVVDGDPVAGAIVFPSLGDTYRVGPDGVFRNGDALSVSDERDPGAATVCPTFWWDYDERDRYAAVTRSIVDRFDDMRRFGCAQLELAMVASGALEGAITDLPTNAWDTVAGVAMVRAAGGTVTDLEGDRWRHDSTGLVASNGAVHEDVLAAARAIDDT